MFDDIRLHVLLNFHLNLIFALLNLDLFVFYFLKNSVEVVQV